MAGKPLSGESPMRGWSPIRRKLAYWVGGAVALYAVLGFLVAPPIVRHQLERVLGEELGRQVTIASVRINPFTLSAAIRNFSLKERDGGKTAAGFEDLSVNLAWSSLSRRGLIIEAADLAKPYVRVVRLADGTYSFQDIIDRVTGGPPAPPGPAPRFALYNIQVHDGRIEFDDRREKTQHSVTDLEIGVPFLSSLPADIAIRVSPRLSAKVNGAPFALAGETRPFQDRHVATLRLDIDDLEVSKYLEYSPVPLAIRVPSGKLSTRLVLSSTAVPGNRLEKLVLSGTARLEGLKVRQADGAPLLALARFSLDLGGLDLVGRRAVVTGLRIDAPEVDIARRKDGGIDLLAALPTAAPAPPSKTADERPFTFMLEQIALSNGRVRFVDRVPGQPVTLALNALSVYAEGLGNASDKDGVVKVRGRLGSAPLAIDGKLALLPRGLALDLKVEARDIDLAPLSPYSVLYAGHAIENGKLSLKHAFVIRDRKLVSENNIRLDQLTLGPQVGNPSASNLPAGLAVSLLKDENGVINLDVPVSGALDDPKVGIGEVFTTALKKPLEKAAAAPFALLGSQFGAGEELAYLEFAAGSAALDPDSLPKLKTLATALAGRPGLRLDVSGRIDPQIDGAELKRAKPKSTDAEVEAELRSLADSRARAAKTWLVQSGKIPAERITVVAAKMSADGIKDSGKPTRVDFALR